MRATLAMMSLLEFMQRLPRSTPGRANAWLAAISLGQRMSLMGRDLPVE